MIYDATHFKYKWMSETMRRFFGVWLLVAFPLVCLWLLIKNVVKEFAAFFVGIVEGIIQDVIPMIFGEHVIKEHEECDCPDCWEKRGRQFTREQLSFLDEILPLEGRCNCPECVKERELVN